MNKIQLDQNKSEQIGLRLSRREALVLLGGASVTWLIGGLPATSRAVSITNQSPCIVRPEQTEGPYFVDERLHRSDIRSDPSNTQVTPGVPLTLTFHVMHLRAGHCEPITNAHVDIWHCDARGIYSDVQDPGFDTTGQKFLRGYQMTDEQGIARFLTIYPGWYPIRTVHIHVKIRTTPSSRMGYEFVSQVYFPDALTDHVHRSPPYSALGPRRVRNRHDFIFRDGGTQLMLEPMPIRDGYTATFPVALHLP